MLFLARLVEPGLPRAPKPLSYVRQKKDEQIGYKPQYLLRSFLFSNKPTLYAYCLGLVLWNGITVRHPVACQAMDTGSMIIGGWGTLLIRKFIALRHILSRLNSR